MVVGSAGYSEVQCNKAKLGWIFNFFHVVSITFTASDTSFKFDAPVAKIIGFFFLAIYLIISV